MSQSTGIGERVTGAVFWNSILLPVKTLLAFVFSFVVVRALSQDGYAAFSSVIALITTVGLWSDLGVESTIARFFPEVEQRFGRGGVLQFATVLLILKFALLAAIIAGLFAFSGPVSSYFGFGSDGQSYLLVASGLLFLGIISDFLYQFLVANFNLKASNTLDILFAAAQPVLLLIFVYLGWGVTGVLLARLLSTALYVAVGVVFARSAWYALMRSPALSGSWADLGSRFARLSILNYGTGLIAFFSDFSFVVLVLAFYRDEAGVALFAVVFARVVNPICRFLMGPVVGVSVPLFARLYVKKETGKIREAYASLSRFLILLLVPSGFGLALLAPNLIRLLFQARYEPAAGIVIVLIVGLFGETLLNPGVQVLVAFEEIRLRLIGGLLTLLAIPLLFVAIPAFGALGAAAAISFVRVVSRLFTTSAVSLKFRLPFPMRFFSKILLASGVMALAMVLPLGLDRPHDTLEAMIRTTLAFVVGAATFVVTVKKLGSIEPADRDRLSTLRMPFKQIILNWL